MSDLTAVLLVLAGLLAGAIAGATILATVLARAAVAAARTGVGLAQAELDRSKALRAAAIDSADELRDAREALDAHSERSGGPLGDAPRPAAPSPTASAYGSPEAPRAPGGAVFGPYRPKRTPCRLCAQLRQLLGMS